MSFSQRWDWHERTPVVTTKLGVIALAGPDNGGTYQYTLSMLQALRHTRGLQITLYGDPQNPDFIKFGYPICRFAESRAQQLVVLIAHRMNVRLPDPFVSEDVLLSPIYALSLLHTSKPFAYTLHDLQAENYFPAPLRGNVSGVSRSTNNCRDGHGALSANPNV